MTAIPLSATAMTPSAGYRDTGAAPVWRRLLAQFQDPLVYLLLGAISAPLTGDGPAGAAARLEAPPSSAVVAVHAPPSLSDAALAGTIAALRTGGFDQVRGVRVGLTIERTHVRDFHAGGAASARRLAAVLAPGGVAEVRDFTHFSPPPSLGSIEIWLSGSAPPQHGAAEPAGKPVAAERDPPAALDAPNAAGAAPLLLISRRSADRGALGPARTLLARLSGRPGVATASVRASPDGRFGGAPAPAATTNDLRPRRRMTASPGAGPRPTGFPSPPTALRPDRTPRKAARPTGKTGAPRDYSAAVCAPNPWDACA